MCVQGYDKIKVNKHLINIYKQFMEEKKQIDYIKVESDAKVL